LFRAFNDDLTRVVTAAVRHVPHQTIEDACSFAWAQFLVHQPSRDRNWRSWLIRTAEREAWLLHRREGRADLRAFDGDVQMSRTDVSVPDAVQFKDDVDEALSLIKQLQPRLQRIAMMRGLGWRYSDISEVTGDSIARIGQLASIANQEIADRRLARLNASGVASPRVARLSELESHPPVWLTRRLVAFPAVSGGRRAIPRRAGRGAAPRSPSTTTGRPSAHAGSKRPSSRRLTTRNSSAFMGWRGGHLTISRTCARDRRAGISATEGASLRVRVL
jgi:DNA-directed RNA polymerase specialized sigma24 family protein